MKAATLVLAVISAPLLLGLSCAPTMEHCSEVSYTRVGANITIKAECTAPIGLPINPGL